MPSTPSATTFKVTVVVPTYRSTAHLDELVASIDGQTMSQDDIEVLLIDDGSPDDTFERLEAFARDRPHYRAIRLEPSGWPSRPRNRGIDEARGEYIVFIDHDDRLFPDALRAAYALASRAGADVLDGKESKSNTPGWAMRDDPRDVENAIDWTHTHPLLPMNPHKMFRTAFLRERDIRFPEGGRQIWEDISFDIAAHARAEVVSLLVETPFYYWNRPAHRTTSGTFHDDLDEYLEAVARVFRWVDEELDQPRFAQLLPRFRAYQLHMRVLPLFRWDERTPAQRERIRAFTSELLPRVPDDADTYLDPWRRIKLAILRAGRYDLVDAHERTFPQLQCTPSTPGAEWSADGLGLAIDLHWRFATKDAATVLTDGSRAWLALAPPVAAFAAEQGLDADVTEWLEGVTYGVDRRSRAEKIDWLLTFGTGAELVVGAEGPGAATDVGIAAGGSVVEAGASGGAGGGPVELHARTAVHWDLADDGPGRLHDGPWDVHIRTVAMRTRIVRQLRTMATGRSWAAVGTALAAAYRTQNDCLSVDIGQTLFSVVDDARTTARVEHGGAARRVVIELPHVAVFTDLAIEGRFVDGQGRTLGSCRFTTSGGTARIEGAAPDRPGTFAVAFGSTRSHARFRLGSRHHITVLRSTEHPRTLTVRGLARRAWHTLPPRLRKRVWLWRHRRR